MRFSARMRWWCTAASISSDGIGARSLLESRSHSTMNSAPASMASSTSRAHRGEPRLAAPRAPRRSGTGRGWSWCVRLPGDGSMCWIFASSSLSITGKSSDDLARVLRAWRSSRLRSGPSPSSERGDDLFADRVERRVGDLRELLGEVVEQQPRALARARRSGCRSPSRRAARRRSAPSARGACAPPPRCSRRCAGAGSTEAGVCTMCSRSGRSFEVDAALVEPLAPRLRTPRAPP